MPALTRERLAGNAYRILGLDAGASQAAIDQAARKMRIFPDPRRIPPTPWDLPSLGNIPRTKNDLEQAVSRLSEPQSRVEERMLWFHTARPKAANDSVEDRERDFFALADSTEPDERHDAALAALHAGVVLDPELEDFPRWERILKLFAGLSQSETYREWLNNLEAVGQFEKRAEPREIDSAIGRLPETIADSLVEKVDDALGLDDFPGCARIVQLLSRLGPAGQRYKERVLDRMEDVLERRCTTATEDVQSRIQCDRDRYQANIGANRRTCTEAAGRYNDMISPLLSEIEHMGADDSRRPRVRGMAAKVLGAVAVGWIWSADFVTAQRTYAVALDLAKDTAMEAGIRADMERNSSMGRQQQQTGYQAVSTRQAVSSGQRKIYASAPSSGSRSGWSMGGGGVVLGIVIIRIALIAFQNTGSRSTSSPTYTPPSYNLPANRSWNRTYTPPASYPNAPPNGFSNNQPFIAPQLPHPIAPTPTWTFPGPGSMAPPRSTPNLPLRLDEGEQQ